MKTKYVIIGKVTYDTRVPEYILEIKVANSRQRNTHGIIHYAHKCCSGWIIKGDVFNTYEEALATFKRMIANIQPPHAKIKGNIRNMYNYQAQKNFSYVNHYKDSIKRFVDSYQLLLDTKKKLEAGEMVVSTDETLLAYPARLFKEHPTHGFQTYGKITEGVPVK